MIVSEALASKWEELGPFLRRAFWQPLHRMMAIFHILPLTAALIVFFTFATNGQLREIYLSYLENLSGDAHWIAATAGFTAAAAALALLSAVLYVAHYELSTMRIGVVYSSYSNPEARSKLRVLQRAAAVILALFPWLGLVAGLFGALLYLIERYDRLKGAGVTEGHLTSMLHLQPPSVWEIAIAAIALGISIAFFLDFYRNSRIRSMGRHLHNAVDGGGAAHLVDQSLPGICERSLDNRRAYGRRIADRHGILSPWNAAQNHLFVDFLSGHRRQSKAPPSARHVCLGAFALACDSACRSAQFRRPRSEADARAPQWRNDHSRDGLVGDGADRGDVARSVQGKPGAEADNPRIARGADRRGADRILGRRRHRRIHVSVHRSHGLDFARIGVRDLGLRAIGLALAEIRISGAGLGLVGDPYQRALPGSHPVHRRRSHRLERGPRSHGASVGPARRRDACHGRGYYSSRQFGEELGLCASRPKPDAP